MYIHLNISFRGINRRTEFYVFNVLKKHSTRYDIDRMHDIRCRG